MIFESDFGKVYYNISGNGPVMVLLHGWGQDSTTFSEIIKRMSNRYTILSIDWLGFGKSDDPIKPLNVDDYVDVLGSLLEHLQIQKPIILGHSFGGRIAIKYFVKTKNALMLILVSSAGIKPKRNIKYYYRVYKFKFLKRIYLLLKLNKKLSKLYQNSGSKDYQNANLIMKQTLSKVVNEDLTPLLSQIKIPTYLLWGIDDEIVPYKDALLFKKYIPDASLITFYYSGHFPYITEQEKFIKVLNHILSSGGLHGKF